MTNRILRASILSALLLFGALAVATPASAAQIACRDVHYVYMSQSTATSRIAVESRDGCVSLPGVPTPPPLCATSYAAGTLGATASAGQAEGSVLRDAGAASGAATGAYASGTYGDVAQWESDLGSVGPFAATDRLVLVQGARAPAYAGELDAAGAAATSATIVVGWAYANDVLGHTGTFVWCTLN